MQRPEQQNQIESDDDSSIDVIAIEISDPATHPSKAGVRYETSTDGQSVSAPEPRCADIHFAGQCHSITPRETMGTENPREFSMRNQWVPCIRV